MIRGVIFVGARILNKLNEYTQNFLNFYCASIWNTTPLIKNQLEGVLMFIGGFLVSLCILIVFIVNFRFVSCRFLCFGT
jgi:hypothetical protein